MSLAYDAILVLSFGGPERREDVLPFLENVLKGKNVPRERMLEVAEHYYHFGGVSPINQQNRELIAALTAELDEHGPRIPVYWGNRNWHPLLPDTIRRMQNDGIKRALTFVTSAFSSYSGCRQYREDIERARTDVGVGAPQIDKLRGFYNHPGFIDATVDRIKNVLGAFPNEQPERTIIVFTAHSIPMAMANGCNYEAQLNEACQLVSGELQGRPWKLAYQSRSGLPSQPWLEPDIRDCPRDIRRLGTFSNVVVVPIGFVSDHMEVLFDLDIEAEQLCQELGLRMMRAKTVGTHPQFMSMIRELINERMSGGQRRSLGIAGPRPDQCPVDCCPSGRPLAQPAERPPLET